MMIQLARPGRNVEHDEEQAEVQQRGAEVTLEDEYRHRGGEDHEDGPEVAGARERESEHLAADHRQRVARGHEVAGEEDRERDLRRARRAGTRTARCRSTPARR